VDIRAVLAKDFRSFGESRSIRVEEIVVSNKRRVAVNNVALASGIRPRSGERRK
jgi:hypothetical protein